MTTCQDSLELLLEHADGTLPDGVAERLKTFLRNELDASKPK